MTTTTTAEAPRPLTEKNSIACLKSDEHMTAMLAALRATGLFEINLDTDSGTVRAHHKTTGREVLAAIQKGEGGPWITRHHKKLFE